MTIDYAELKKTAEAATQGHWSVPHLCKDSHTCNCAYVFSGDYLGGIAEVYVDNGKPVSEGGNDCPPLEMAKANGRFMSAARPEVVLELLDDIERLQGDTSSMRGSLKQYSINMKKSIKASGRIQRENDKLKSEIARSTEREILQLAEIEGLRKVAIELRRYAACENLHHVKADQHEADEACKVLHRIDLAMSPWRKP